MNIDDKHIQQAFWAGGVRECRLPALEGFGD